MMALILVSSLRSPLYLLFCWTLALSRFLCDDYSLACVDAWVLPLTKSAMRNLSDPRLKLRTSTCPSLQRTLSSKSSQSSSSSGSTTSPASTSLLLSSSSSFSSSNKFNVVLEPSSPDNPDAFDSFKLGCPKVHRYSARENNDSMDEGTEYVMWYHGRSITDQKLNGGKLPPLSTGRIGRATSRNGLVWKKQTVGSASEDRTDVSLGINKDSWWAFDTTHVGLGSVLLPMSTPAVMTEGGVYLLYYMGGNGEETPLQDYVSQKVPATSTIQGMNMKIGVALSQDGITYGRVEGDDPSGAVVVPTGDELYCGWPEVVVNVDGSPDEAFIMYYSTMLKSTQQKCIAYATSSDGFRWYKKGVCMYPSSSDDANDASFVVDDSLGCSRCCVVKDAFYEKTDRSWKETPKNNNDSYFIMYYEGVSKKDGKHRIFKAISRDGKSQWTKAGVVLDVSQNGDETVEGTSWDSMGVGSPNIIRLDDGSSRMYYTGQGNNGSTAIGVAKCLYGSNSWIREQATISLLSMSGSE